MTPGSDDSTAADGSSTDDAMATEKDEEETSGDADQSVTIGGEKDPSLSKLIIYIYIYITIKHHLN